MKKKLKMFKVILFTTLLCLHFGYTQQTKKEVFLAVRDLVEGFLIAIAPAKVDRCKEGELVVNLHKMDRNGRIVKTVRAHKNEVIKSTDKGKIAMIFPSYNDNPNGLEMRDAAKALIKNKDIDVYMVETKKVSLFLKSILTDFEMHFLSFIAFLYNYYRNVTGQIIDLDCHLSRKIR